MSGLADDVGVALPNLMEALLFLRRGREILQPCEIEDVVVLAAEELDAVIAGLRDREIAMGFGHRAAQREVYSGHRVIGAAGRDEPALGHVFPSSKDTAAKSA